MSAFTDRADERLQFGQMTFILAAFPDTLVLKTEHTASQSVNKGNKIAATTQWAASTQQLAHGIQQQ